MADDIVTRALAGLSYNILLLAALAGGALIAPSLRHTAPAAGRLMLAGCGLMFVAVVLNFLLYGYFGWRSQRENWAVSEVLQAVYATDLLMTLLRATGFLLLVAAALRGRARPTRTTDLADWVSDDEDDLDDAADIRPAPRDPPR